jgi:hypothetical protein
MGPWKMLELKIQERGWPPWEVVELEIRERPPSTLRNVDGGPLGGADAEDPGASTINDKKRRRWAHGRYRS